MSGNDIFKSINNAILDLQGSSLQSYERPIKNIGRLLRDDQFKEVNARLTNGLDLKKFLEESKKTQGGMVGTAKLQWPDDHEKTLGLQLLMVESLADDPESMIHISHQFFSGGSKIINGIHNLTRQIIVPFARDYKDYVMSNATHQPKILLPKSDKIFIVHGHDVAIRESVARFLEGVGFRPIILHEQANKGQTVIEKVEAHSDVGFAVVLLTPDDEGCVKDGELEPRARQNVLLELGYFIGKLGRSRVCAIKKGAVSIPSDFAGALWTEFDASGAWKLALGRELAAAEYEIDWNKIMRR
ncbi:putative nucleotide-binding protein with TIR-like domain [Nitrospirillum viridazoti]|uniref:CD-NTase-associated protein 12/Pycsar effector protein TIR domain-containing protein n=2 Tax=Nitrospirillum TaxID=1543705 RepID=A0A248JY73_9PROT|nr:hypothetical protein Y958_20700 [Nitrospirillum amazonense CBAmc]TWB40091.1 putative nucleotide-binding protein with TIR-like domain [Nitrospirillum amazonense]